MKKSIRNSLVYLSIFVFTFVSLPLGPAVNTYAQSAADTSTTTTTTTGTKTCDQTFYSNNDILFYNPCATTSCGNNAAGSITANVTSVHGNNNGEKIFNFWLDAGLTAQQAAGITGSMQSEGSFSPFRQQIGKAWGTGGWGIAQFDSSGQRQAVSAYLTTALGAALFNQYYKPDYGGSVSPSAGYIPAGVPVDVNDKFLLGELNYLLQHIQSLIPNSTRTGFLKADYSQVVPANTTLYNYLKTLVLAQDSAIAWTYLYEYPGNIKATAATRANNAAAIMTLYSTGTGTSTACGGSLTSGGMTLAQGVKFMDDYKNNPSNVQYIAGAGTDCPGGPLSNCVSFSVYFARKYTNLKESGAAGNGSTVVAHLISLNPTAKNGHSPQPYAIFSTPSGVQMCGNIKCGHTGVILGVDKARGVVVVGEAACGAAASWDTAREYPLSKFDSAAYTYIYTDGLLKGAVQ
jgi:hypothetical protein